MTTDLSRSQLNPATRWHRRARGVENVGYGVGLVQVILWCSGLSYPSAGPDLIDLVCGYACTRSGGKGGSRVRGKEGDSSSASQPQAGGQEMQALDCKGWFPQQLGLWLCSRSGRHFDGRPAHRGSCDIQVVQIVHHAIGGAKPLRRKRESPKAKGFRSTASPVSTRSGLSVGCLTRRRAVGVGQWAGTLHNLRRFRGRRAWAHLVAGTGPLGSFFRHLRGGTNSGCVRQASESQSKLQARKQRQLFLLINGLHRGSSPYRSAYLPPCPSRTPWSMAATRGVLARRLRAGAGPGTTRKPFPHFFARFGPGMCPAPPTLPRQAGTPPLPRCPTRTRDHQTYFSHASGRHKLSLIFPPSTIPSASCLNCPLQEPPRPSHCAPLAPGC